MRPADRAPAPIPRDWADQQLRQAVADVRQAVADARRRSGAPRSRRRTGAEPAPEPSVRYGSMPPAAVYCRACGRGRRNVAVVSAELLGAGPAEVAEYGGFPVPLCDGCFAARRLHPPTGTKWMVVERYARPSGAAA